MDRQACGTLNRFLSARHINGLVRLWDVAATNLLFSTQAALYIGFDGAIDFSPDSKSIAIAQSPDSTRLYEIATGQERKRFASGSKPFALRFSPDGQQLAVTDDSDLQIWRVASGAKEKTFQINSGNINKVHWAPSTINQPLIRVDSRNSRQSPFRTTVQNDSTFRVPRSGFLSPHPRSSGPICG